MLKDDRTNSLGALLQKDLKNDVPESVLAQVPQDDRVLVENILLVAQAELEMLNLASATVVVAAGTLRISCTLAGPSPIVSLANMRSVQSYSPARVRDVRAMLSENRLLLVIDVHNANSRVSASEIEVVRLTKKRRFF
jgi:hypothetical protein